MAFSVTDAVYRTLKSAGGVTGKACFWDVSRESRNSGCKVTGDRSANNDRLTAVIFCRRLSSAKCCTTMG